MLTNDVCLRRFGPRLVIIFGASTTFSMLVSSSGPSLGFPGNGAPGMIIPGIAKPPKRFTGFGFGSSASSVVGLGCTFGLGGSCWNWTLSSGFAAGGAGFAAGGAGFAAGGAGFAAGGAGFAAGGAGLEGGGFGFSSSWSSLSLEVSFCGSSSFWSSSFGDSSLLDSSSFASSCLGSGLGLGGGDVSWIAPPC